MTKVVLVASVKGGTGKTLISINLAKRLKDKGLKVALLDADITSSYFKQFTKLDKRPVITDDYIGFAEWDGVKVFSMSLLDTGPVSMYGFSERQILEDIYNYGDWRDSDILIIDLPAGAEDIYKEVLRLWGKEIAGEIIVAIPFAHRSIEQAIKLAIYYGVPVLGVIENMAYIDCDGKRIYVFGKPIAKSIADKYGVPFLGEIPLDPRIAEGLEKGDPTIPGDVAGPVEKAVEAIVRAPVGKFYESWTRRVKKLLQKELIKLIAHGLITINKSFNIKELREKYGFTGGKVFSLAITDEDNNLVALFNFKVKEDKVVLVKGRVKPEWIIEVPYTTLVDIVRGYRDVGGRKIPFDAKTAWSIGELRVYGKASTNMLFKVVDTLLSNPDIVGEARSRLEKIISLVG